MGDDTYAPNDDYTYDNYSDDGYTYTPPSIQQDDVGRQQSDRHVSFKDDSSIIDHSPRHQQQATHIGRGRGGVVGVSVTDANKGAKNSKNSKRAALAKIKANSANKANTSSRKESNNAGSIRVIATTAQEKHNLKDDRTTVIVHTNLPPPPKTKIITVRRETSDPFDDDDDALGGDFVDCCYNLQNGPLSLRFLVCFVALFMVIASSIDFDETGYYGEISFFYSAVSLYLWIFAIFIISLEIRPFRSAPTEIHRITLRNVRVLRFSWGRGFLYFFSGGLQLCLLTTWNMIAGGLMMVIGLLTYFLGQRAHGKMKKFVRKLGSLNNIDIKFNKYDRDRDGLLDPEEFGNWIADLDVKMTFDDFVVVFTAIDRNSDRYITREDIGAWFTKYKAQNKGKNTASLALV